MPYLLLAAAIVLEVMATINVRLSDGFTRLVPSILVVIGYLGAFGLLSQVLKAGMPSGVAYGIWAAAGVALVAIIGAVLLGDTLTPVQVGASCQDHSSDCSRYCSVPLRWSITLVVAGVLALELGAAQ